jgi:3-oxoadipate enol-lactonase
MPTPRTVRVPGRGEFFVRDTGGDGPPVMLLHGWMASADLNWWVAYADAAAVLSRLGAAPAVVVGYSMGGAIAQLVARDHPEAVSGLILSGTAQHWQDPQAKRYFKTMLFLGLMISLSPKLFWRYGLWQMGLRGGEQKVWVHSELMRHSAREIAEAGRELGRFDSRPWLGSLTVPTAVVVTTRDELVPVRNQRALAEAARARVFEAPVTHMEVGSRGERYNPELLRAIAAVSGLQTRPAPGPEAASTAAAA